MHRRVHVAKSELVGGKLSVRVHVPLAQEQDHLLLRILRVQMRDRDHVKSKVPRGKPRILPLVRHRDNVAAVQVRPVVVAAGEPLGGWRRAGGISMQPFLGDIMVKLLAPQQTSRRLMNDIALRIVELREDDRVVVCARLADAVGEDFFKRRAQRFGWRFLFREETERHRLRLAGRNMQHVMQRRLRAGHRGVHRGGFSVHDVFVEGVLSERPLRTRAPQRARVRLVFREERGREFSRRITSRLEGKTAEHLLVQREAVLVLQRDRRLE